MKPAWNELGDEYAGSTSVLIGDVDCTSDGEALCTKYKVQGYPTIKYFKDGNVMGQDYQGGRDLEGLKQFVQENLELKCNVEDLENCSEEEKAYILKMKSKPKEDRTKQFTRLTGMQGESMKAELKRWLNQRVSILKSLGANVQEEL